MAAHMFGAWLVERQVVSAEAVIKALDRQRASRIPIGRIALTNGSMTVAQVFDVLNAQAGTSRLFGEIAVERGYLDNAVLAELLLEQRRRHVPVGLILVDMGELEPDVLRRELELFKQQGEPPI